VVCGREEEVVEEAVPVWACRTMASRIEAGRKEAKLSNMPSSVR